jgi:endonuclease/exonuclease/phosphatase family metal-dependent hydrolase
MFVSPDVHVADFRVLTDKVSDHSPLLLEFN